MRLALALFLLLTPCSMEEEETSLPPPAAASSPRGSSIPMDRGPAPPPPALIYSTPLGHALRS